MDKSINLNELKTPQDVQQLARTLRDAFEELDTLYTDTAPNGTIQSRQGRIAVYDNSGVYTTWLNVDGDTTWQQLDANTLPLWEIDGTETQLKTADEIDMQSKKIINLLDPTADQDAASKKYVDDNDSYLSGEAAGGVLAGTYPNPSFATTSVKMKTGEYTGDGNATKAITGVGFQAKAIIIIPQVSGKNIGLKTDQEGTKTMYWQAGTYYEDDFIISFGADGFTLGDGSGGSSGDHFNLNNQVYTYIALTY